MGKPSWACLSHRSLEGGTKVQQIIIGYFVAPISIGLFHLIYKYEESTLNENNLKTNNTERNNFEKSNFKTTIFLNFERVCSRTWAPEGPDFGVLHVDHVDEVETWKTKLKNKLKWPLYRRIVCLIKSFNQSNNVHSWKTETFFKIWDLENLSSLILNHST